MPQLAQNLAVEYCRPGDLRPHPNNPRRHPATQIAQLAESIETFGWTVPILVDEEGVILAGHGRWQVATQMELDMVPVVVIGGLSEERKRAYVLADNKLADNAHWDATAVLAELEFLTGAGIEVETLGFTENDMLGLHSMVDDTSFPDEHVTPVVETGGTVIESDTEPTALQGDGQPSLGDERLDNDEPGDNESDVPFDTADMPEGTVLLPVHFTPSQRDRLLESLKQVQQDEDVDNDADALLLLADLYAERAGVDVEAV